VDRQIRFEFPTEEETTDEQRRLVGELLYDAFGDDGALGRGYNLHRPTYRSLAWDGELLVGTSMGSLPACDPPLRVYGGGDTVVREGWRGLGIARTFNEYGLSRADARGIEVFLASTENLGPLLESLGYRRVVPGELSLEEDGEVRPVTVPWYIRWFREPAPFVLKARF
jgi:hypothetical protein